MALAVFAISSMTTISLAVFTKVRLVRSRDVTLTRYVPIISLIGYEVVPAKC